MQPKDEVCLLKLLSCFIVYLSAWKSIPVTKGTISPEPLQLI
jgi:hypothetical protein